MKGKGRRKTFQNNEDSGSRVPSKAEKGFRRKELLRGEGELQKGSKKGGGLKERTPKKGVCVSWDVLTGDHGEKYNKKKRGLRLRMLEPARNWGVTTEKKNYSPSQRGECFK